MRELTDLPQGWLLSLMGIIVLFTLTGCGTTRSTDTTRAATEMLLISQAVDRAISQIDFSPLAGRSVYLDDTQIDRTTVDRGYIIGSLRQQIAAHGAFLQDEKRMATYIVEPRTGSIGTDRHTLLVGTPQVSLPTIVPGIPTNIPEIALVKKTDQKGVAKIAVFAYNRVTGRAVWQSGLIEETSRVKDTWLFGAGPFSRGSIRRGTELAGEELPSLPKVPTFFGFHEGDPIEPAVVQTTASGGDLQSKSAFTWTNSEQASPPQPVPMGLMSLTGPGALIYHPIIK